MTDFLTGLDPQIIELFFQVGIAGAVMVFTIVMLLAFVAAINRQQRAFAQALDQNNERWKNHLVGERTLDRQERQTIMDHTTKAIENSYSRMGQSINGVDRQLKHLTVTTINHDRRMTILMGKLVAGERVDVDLPELAEGLETPPFVQSGEAQHGR